jgi:hypothetical protein
MCLVWTTEQKATFTLNNINWFFFITEVEGVFCAVRAEFLYKNEHISSLKG